MASFSLEQLDMVRRLKQSGLSKEDILAAFDSFDATDRDLGSTYHLPASIAFQLQALQAMTLNATTNIITTATTNTNFNTITNNNNNTTTTTTNYNANNNISISVNKTSFSNLFSSNNVAVIPNNNKNNLLINNIKLSQDIVVTPVVHNTTATSLSNNNSTNSQENNNHLDHPYYPPPTNNNASLSNNVTSISSNNISINNNTTSNHTELFNNNNNNNDLEVDNKEFHDFINHGEVACCEEIRHFATKHNIKQQQIATLAGICQSYVSRYMKGDIYDMSERSRRSIQKWYLVYRHSPASIAYAVNAAQHLIGMSSSKRPCSLDQLDFTADSAFPRRERFVFRAGHLEILERYFHDNNYPLYETREKIAQSCNLVTQNTAGRELTEREKVTTQIISNWFANKRKELKKLAKEEGLMDVSMVPVRPRGHPSRVYSDLIQHSRHPDPPSNNNSTDNNSSTPPTQLNGHPHMIIPTARAQALDSN